MDARSSSSLLALEGPGVRGGTSATCKTRDKEAYKEIIIKLNLPDVYAIRVCFWALASQFPWVCNPKHIPNPCSCNCSIFAKSCICVQFFAQDQACFVGIAAWMRALFQNIQIAKHGKVDCRGTRVLLLVLGATTAEFATTSSRTADFA